MADNRFARPLADLDPEEQQLVRPAVAAARTSFAGFEERPASDYQKAPGLSAEETWAKVAEELGRVAALAALGGYRDRALEVADIELIHRAIFEPVFGSRTLGLRWRRKHQVTFPIVTGTQEAPHPDIRRGSGGRQVKPKLRKALAAFEDDVDALATAEQPPLRDAVQAAVKLYVKVIGIHPFFDGNGRTAHAVASYSLQRCGLVELALPPSNATRWALGRALRQDGSQSYEPLTDIVVETIRDSAGDRVADA